jgi:hypothetical protein
MNMPSVPCKDCTNRTMRCHTTCNEYKEYRAKQDEVNKINRPTEEEIMDMEFNRKRKDRRIKRNRKY